MRCPGGYPKFKALKVDDSYLPTWLQSLGYNTYYTGEPWQLRHRDACLSGRSAHVAGSIFTCTCVLRQTPRRQIPGRLQCPQLQRHTQR